MSDYLFDGEHVDDELDAEVARLERTLSPLRHKGVAPELPAMVPARRRSRVWLPTTAFAAAAMIAFLVLHRPTPIPAPVVPSWALNERDRLPLNAWLDTTQPATLRVDTIGSASIAAQSRVRVVAMGDVREVEIDHGALTAVISAAPRHFVVRTPYLKAIDLGCAFSLAIDEKGEGKLVVTQGAVALVDSDGNEHRVEAGFECETVHSHVGPIVASNSASQGRPSDAHDHAKSVSTNEQAQRAVELDHMKKPHRSAHAHSDLSTIPPPRVLHPDSIYER